MVFECGIGWSELIHDLSVKIEKILERKSDKPVILENVNKFEMYATQVKEKYGTLRFYMSLMTDEIEDLIEEAEALSSQTCECCGMPGKMRGKSWYEVRCDNCYKETK